MNNNNCWESIFILHESIQYRDTFFKTLKPYVSMWKNIWDIYPPLNTSSILSFQIHFLKIQSVTAPDLKLVISKTRKLTTCWLWILWSRANRAGLASRLRDKDRQAFMLLFSTQKAQRRNHSWSVSINAGEWMHRLLKRRSSTLILGCQYRLPVDLGRRLYQSKEHIHFIPRT